MRGKIKTITITITARRVKSSARGDGRGSTADRPGMDSNVQHDAADSVCQRRGCAGGSGSFVVDEGTTLTVCLRWKTRPTRIEVHR